MSGRELLSLSFFFRTPKPACRPCSPEVPSTRNEGEAGRCPKSETQFINDVTLTMDKKDDDHVGGVLVN
jgi:hypothetical protein